MNFLKKLWQKNSGSSPEEDFWAWFSVNQSSFLAAVKKDDADYIHHHFLNKIEPRLQALNDKFYFEAGMFDDNVAELVITAEGDIKSFVFVEGLIALSPKLDNWKFTALKPSTGNGRIKMDGQMFDSDTITFYCLEQEQYPDEVDLVLIHRNFTAQNKDLITHGTLLYLDSLLGELSLATLVDNVTVIGPDMQEHTPISVEKLTDFLVWREKEFVEKYNGVRHNTENDNYAGVEGTDEDGFPSIAILDTDLLTWDAKASHPWMLVLQIDYEKNSALSNNGMPNKKYLELMTRFEHALSERLADSDGYLNLGRNTYKGKRQIYVACKEFRNASRNVHELILENKKELICSYEIYKDKYWRTMEAFDPGPAD